MKSFNVVKYCVLGILLLATIPFVFGIPFNVIRHQYDLKNAFLRVLLYPLVETKWAPGFSEEKFSKIIPSMIKEEVLEIMGTPLFIGEPTSSYSCYWAYTWDKNDKDSAYDVRVVYFNIAGTVSQVERSIR
jgi:hypothetical protein